MPGCMKNSLEHLKATQEELVQSEKMAALGQLVAGIAHEINTPLGAIRASIANISDALNESIHQLPQLFQRLTPSRLQDFLALLEAAFKDKKNITSREERKFKRKLIAQLEDYEIALLQAEDNTLQAAYNLSIQQTSSQNIMMAVERASKIVFALKSYAHTDSQGHKKIKANVTECLDVVLTLYYTQLKHGIEVTTHYQDVPDILCCSDELNQVWTNIIHNAIQAMDNQGTLEITVAQQDDYIVVQITDSGKGIEENIKPRIFEPFFTTKPAGEGSGLGLDIVRRIIDKHQGRIEVESRPGKTTFSVFLPV